jgi:hypothetical protein
VKKSLLHLQSLLAIMLLIALISTTTASADRLLIYMDLGQTDHLKAYGVAYWCLEQGYNVEWLLNYRGGSFLTDAAEEITVVCRLRDVAFELVGGAQIAAIYQEIEESNMDVVLLEKAPSIAIYTPPSTEPWDDAVTLALTYAEIPYKTLWDEGVFLGQLEEYDWLHLHHEDFTGQFGKFITFQNQEWYRRQKIESEAMARKTGFSKVPDEKKAVVNMIKDYVIRGGFLFAMCCAPNTMDIALAAEGVDVVPTEYDGDPVDPNYQAQLDFSKSFAFENFVLETNPYFSPFANIDVNRVNTPGRLRALDFTLFDFSAKYDPVPTMLVQNHVAYIKGYYGLLTSFNKEVIKKSVTILAEVPGKNRAKYIHGNLGRGTFTFLGGHDPEDYEHAIGDPPTQLSLHKNSPGYRLILNNILFPAAKKRERKT